MIRQKELEDAWALRQQEVLDAGGLHIIGTERHESRRIDNQLRGRAGRQGDLALVVFIYLLKIIFCGYLVARSSER